MREVSGEALSTIHDHRQRARSEASQELLAAGRGD
jgi:hypothetical protein